MTQSQGWRGKGPEVSRQRLGHGPSDPTPDGEATRAVMQAKDGVPDQAMTSARVHGGVARFRPEQNPTIGSDSSPTAPPASGDTVPERAGREGARRAGRGSVGVDSGRHDGVSSPIDCIHQAHEQTTTRSASIKDTEPEWCRRSALPGDMTTSPEPTQFVLADSI
jgi:hypothetical protein